MHHYIKLIGPTTFPVKSTMVPTIKKNAKTKFHTHSFPQLRGFFSEFCPKIGDIKNKG